MADKRTNGSPAPPDELFQYRAADGVVHVLRDMSDPQLQQFYNEAVMNDQKALGELHACTERLQLAFSASRAVNRALSAAEFEMERRKKKIMVVSSVREAIRG